MKSLFIKMKTNGIYSLGFDILWDNENFLFDSGESLGVFDQLNVALQDGEQGRIIVGGQNLTKRHVTGESEIAKIDFEWADEAIDEPVAFLIENVVAKNKNGADISCNVIATDYEPDEINTIIEFVWRVAA
jgi:hypothetical protein